MRVIKAVPGQEPVAVDIGNEVDDMDAVVGGFPKQFHNVPSGPRRLVFYCNENGPAYKLPANRQLPDSETPIVGTILVVAFNGSAEVDMTEQEVADTIQTINGWSNVYQPPPPPCTHPRVVPGVLGGSMCAVCTKVL